MRYRDPGDLAGTLDALAAAGIELVEITLDTPGALEAVARAAGDGRMVGVGTVVRPDQVRACADAGARFVVGPGLVCEVVETAQELGLEAIPGVFTATEILAARALDVRGMKLFPASVGGPAHVRALRAPFPTERFLTTGGIEIEDVADYLAAGAACVGLGGGLVGDVPPASPAELDRIATRAALAVAAAGAPSSPAREPDP